MKPLNIFDHKELRKQLHLQQKHAFDLDNDINWDRGIDLKKSFLPMDHDSIAFPGASDEQKLALSQFMGIVINTTISEMEEVAFRLRSVAWRDILDSYPVNPEMYALGEQFFAEEEKHSRLFKRFNEHFCKKCDIEPNLLKEIVPQAYGATFQKAIIKNAKAGGHAFWWVIAVVEEVALLLYQSMYRHRKELDPLFYQVHKKHFEEESKHTNYAFLMLDLIQKRNTSFKQRLHNRVDLIYSELFSAAWIISELSKIKRVKEYSKENEFFKVLASCLPLMEAQNTAGLVQRLFVSAPYISFMLNKNYHRLSKQSAKQHGAFSFVYPTPAKQDLTVSQLSKTSAEAIWEVR